MQQSVELFTSVMEIEHSDCASWEPAGQGKAR